MERAKTKLIGAYVTESYYNKIQKISKEQNRSIAYLVREALDKCYNEVIVNEVVPNAGESTVETTN